MPSTNPRIVTTLPPKQHAALKQYSKRTGVPMSEVVRRAVASFIKTN